MNFLKKKSKFLSIDIGSYSIKFIETEYFENKIFIKNLGYAILEPDTFVEGYLISQNNIIETIKTFCKEFSISTNSVATIIPGNKAIIKRIKLPSSELDTENLEEKIYFQAEQTIPYNLNEVKLSFDIINPNLEEEEEIEIFLVAAKTEIIHDYRTILEECKLTPMIADIDFFCLQNIFEYNYGEEYKEEIVGILNLGSFFSNLIIIHGNEGIFYRDFNIGSSNITKNLQRKLKISFYDAEKMKLNNVNNLVFKEEKKNFFNEIKKELSKSFELFINSSSYDKIDIMFICGGGSMLKGFKQFLEKSFPNIKFEYFNPFKNFIFDEKKIDKKYLEYISPLFSIASGGALRGVEID